MSFFKKIFSSEKKETLDKGLEKSKTSFFSKLNKAVAGKSKVDDDVLDNLEEVLVTSDVGVDTTLKIIERIEERVARDKYLGTSELNQILREEIAGLLSETNSGEAQEISISTDVKPYVIMVVGVNGVGKTTTIGKLANQFKNKGLNVVLGAADTFRAAAIDQLQVWADRVDVPIVKQKMGSDPASVAFDTLQSAVTQNADVVIRMPCGAGVAAGPFHSQTNEAWFTKTPGLKVVYPAFPYDAKGLLTTAINDPNPVLFFEHKALYRRIRQDVPKDYYTLPLGKASLLQKGEAVTIISYGAAVHWALETLENNLDISADLIDLRTLQPLDENTIINSVKKTGRAIILQEDSLFGGIASDISAMIMEDCFEYLDAPVKRVASMETPIPFAAQLEEQYLAKARFEEALRELMEY